MLTDFEGYMNKVKRPKPDHLEFECPKCHAYKVRCNQCLDWGWVTAADAHCVHDLTESYIGGSRFLYACKKCDRKFTTDSSG